MGVQRARVASTTGLARGRSAEIAERRARVGAFHSRALELDGAGPVHLLLHGYADSADTWRQVLEHLARRGRAALALDLPGFADAQPLAEDEPVLEQITAFALAAVRTAAQRGREVVLVGNSLGASAALMAAAEDPRAISGVVAIAPAGFDMAGWIYRLETFSLLQLALRLPPVVPATVLQGIVGLIYRQLTVHEQGAVSDDHVRSFARRLSDRDTLRRYLAVARRLTPELSLPAELDGLEPPVLVVWGREDRMLSYRNADLVRELIPHARLELLDRCGHCPQVERPMKTTELILSMSAVVPTERR